MQHHPGTGLCHRPAQAAVACKRWSRLTQGRLHLPHKAPRHGVELTFDHRRNGFMKFETSRRSFLGATAGMAGLSAIGATPAPPPVEPEDNETQLERLCQ